MNQAQPPFLIRPVRKGQPLSGAQLSKLTGALNRMNAGCASPSQVLSGDNPPETYGMNNMQPPFLMRPFRKGQQITAQQLGSVSRGINRMVAGCAQPQQIIPLISNTQQSAIDTIIEVNPGVIIIPDTTKIIAADGSQYPDTPWGGSGQWHWPDGTNGHLGPQKPLIQFGTGTFKWGLNLFPYFYVMNPSGASSWSITATATLDLLDNTGALLSQIVLNFARSYVYLGSNSESITYTISGTPIGYFNQVRFTMATTSYSDTIYCGLHLFYYLQNPVEI